MRPHRPSELTADVVDHWLAGKSGQLSTDTLACSLLSSSGPPIEDIARRELTRDGARID
ncbi:MAG TPA: hypothetical protein VF241_03255 [Propionibacteriaceae bacterium]